MTRRAGRTKLWVVALAAALLLPTAVASFARRVVSTTPTTGVRWVQTSGGPMAIEVEPASPAERAGLVAGDRLVAIGGQPAASVFDANQIGWGVDRAGTIPLRVVREGATLELRIVPDQRAQSEIYVYLAVVGLAFLVSGLFIAIRWTNIRGGFLYAMLATVLFAQFVLSHTGVGDVLDWIIYWGDVLAGALGPALLVHLAVVLSRTSLRRSRWIVATCYAASLALTAVSVWLSPAAGGGAYAFADPLRALELGDRLEPLLLAAALAAAVALLGRSYLHSSSVLHRSQMRWLLWGLGLGLGPAVALYAVPFSLGASELPGWATFLAVAPTLFVPAAFTAALARYRLHDLDDLLVRGLTEVSAIFCTFAIYAAAAFLLRELIAEFVPLSRSATRYIGFGIAAVCYPQCRSWVRAGVEKAFYRKRYSYRSTLLDWARELNAETDLPSLVERLRERVRATLGVPSAAVLVQTATGSFESLDDPGGFESFRPDATTRRRLEREPYVQIDAGAQPLMSWVRYLFPMRVKGDLRAVLAIADRGELEEPLSTEDRALLATLAAHAATALEAARLVLEVRQRAAEVERLHARQEQILESSAVGLLLLDDDGRIQAWNRALEGIYGLGRESVLGARLNDVFPLNVVRRLEREARKGDQGAGSRIFRLSMVNRAGQRVVVNMAISQVEGAGGRVVTFDDVTQRVKLEEQLLQQERLASLGLLAAGVAHEINTPLTGISSYTQLLLEDCGEDGKRELLQKIERQTERATHITRSLLNLARPGDTTLELLDINAVANEVLQLFEPQVRGRGISLRTSLAEGLPPIQGHRGKLQQVLLNLLMNARDAVNGDGVISLETSCPDGRVVIEVMDSGVGITEEDLPRIFDPFFTTKGRGKGTGLGLSVSYGIVREHDGDIVVESTPNRFTRFRVELPRAGAVRALA